MHRPSLNNQRFDVLVIGGGIVGAGVARDAADRGLRTLLVEQADFASGTSSRSSRLLHGGLRYLAQGRVGLVREASLEKMRLHRNAPHLAEPLPFLFPVWRGDPWPLWKLTLGVRVYDWLCGRRNLGPSARIAAPQAAALLPGLRSDELLGATRHFDALTNDARLVVDTLLTASEAGAEVRNYTRFVGGQRSGKLWRCELHDEQLEQVQHVQASVIVNAAGAWAPQFPASRVRLRLTEGAHLVIDRERLPVREAAVLTEGQRILFVIPWGKRVILGTTDTDYEGDPAAVRTETSDVDYILNVVNRAFPEARLDHDDVLADWAGVRPLVASGKHGSPSNLSRSHVIRVAEPGWIDIAGGKLTTYRLMAEQVIDRGGGFLDRRPRKSTTAHAPIVAGKFSGVLPPELCREVVAECCRNEWAVHLDDVLTRRTSWRYYHTPQEDAAQQTATWMAEELGWSEAEKQSELQRAGFAVQS